jgi:hypothetical protein
MGFEYTPPPYSPESGVRIEWEDDWRISVAASDGEVVLRADRAGLVSLAKHLLALAQDAVPPGSHIHYDAGEALDGHIASASAHRCHRPPSFARLTLL